jgi:hypothetical protein
MANKEEFKKVLRIEADLRGLTTDEEKQNYIYQSLANFFYEPRGANDKNPANNPVFKRLISELHCTRERR